jgi:hypothetical protein
VAKAELDRDRAVEGFELAGFEAAKARADAVPGNCSELVGDRRRRRLP